MKKAVIFDMDGVLIDSEPIYMYQMLAFFDRYGIHVDRKEAVKIVGSSHEDSLKMMASWWKEAITPEDFESLFTNGYHSEEWSYSDILNPYVKFILSRLKEENFKVAIASSSPMESILSMVDECEISRYFDLFVTGRDFPKSKPDPTVYLSTMEKLGVLPNETIIIEDSNYGIEAGKKAGGTVIAIQDSRFYDDQSGSDYLVFDLLEAYLTVLKIKGGK